MSENDTPRRWLDPTFNVPSIIAIVTLAVGLVASQVRSDAHIETMAKQVTAMQVKLDGFTTLLVDAAVTRQRMTEFDRRLDIVERR